MMFKKIFFNLDETRLLFFWRVIGQNVLLVVFMLAGSLGLQLLLFLGLTKPFSITSPVGLFYTSIIMVLAVFLSVFLAGLWFDRRPLSGFGFRINKSWWIDFCFGLELGAILITLIFFVEWAAGWVTITGFFQSYQGIPFAAAIMMMIVTFLAVGFYEELLFRGYYMTNISEWLGHFKWFKPRQAVLAAWLLTSLVFGLTHAFNPNASLISTVSIMLAGLLLLGLGYLLTGELAVPIGVHITWNFFQGSIYGFSVSGMDAGVISLVAINQGGPDWITGGAFGPEAGLLGILAMLLGGWLIILWEKHKHSKASIHDQLANPLLGVKQ